MRFIGANLAGDEKLKIRFFNKNVEKPNQFTNS